MIRYSRMSSAPSRRLAFSSAKVSKSPGTHQFFLIVDSAQWIARLVPLGVKLVQWRIKDRPETELCTDYK